MRILHFINNIDLSWYNMLADTARAQQQRGHDVIIVVPPGGSNYKRLVKDGLPAKPLAVRSSKFDYLAAWQLSRMIRREKVDVLHAHLTSSALLGSAAARWAGIPCVASVLKLTKKRRYMRCDFLLPFSGAVRDDLLSQGVPEDRMRLVYTGMDFNRFFSGCHAGDNAREEFGFEPSHRVIGSIARLVPMKGHTYLVAAVPHVMKKYPEARFLLVGDGPLRAELVAQAAALGVERFITFPGTRLDLQRILATVDLVAMASVDKEGLPMILVESALMRKPIVMTDVAGIREMITDGKTGYLVPPKNPEALAAAICEALEKPDEAKRRAAAAEERVRLAFDVRETTRIMDEVYKSLLRKTRADEHRND